MVESADLSDHRSDLRGGIQKHANVIFAKDSWLDGLNY